MSALKDADRIKKVAKKRLLLQKEIRAVNFSLLY